MCFTIRHGKRLGETLKLPSLSRVSGASRSRPASRKLQRLVSVSSRTKFWTSRSRLGLGSEGFVHIPDSWALKAVTRWTFYSLTNLLFTPPTKQSRLNGGQMFSSDVYMSVYAQHTFIVNSVKTTSHFGVHVCIDGLDMVPYKFLEKSPGAWLGLRKQ